MFSAIESEYIKSIISSYMNNGYKYYIAHTITETNNPYDIALIFTNDKVEAICDYIYFVKNAVIIYIDSSNRNDNNYSLSVHNREYIYRGSFTGSYEIHEAEFVYSNIPVSYDITGTVLNGDIMTSGLINKQSFDLSFITVFLLCIILGFIFVNKVMFK